MNLRLREGETGKVGYVRREEGEEGGGDEWEQEV